MHDRRGPLAGRAPCRRLRAGGLHRQPRFRFRRFHDARRRSRPCRARALDVAGSRIAHLSEIKGYPGPAQGCLYWLPVLAGTLESSSGNTSAVGLVAYRRFPTPGVPNGSSPSSRRFRHSQSRRSHDGRYRVHGSARRRLTWTGPTPGAVCQSEPSPSADDSRARHVAARNRAVVLEAARQPVERTARRIRPATSNPSTASLPFARCAQVPMRPVGRDSPADSSVPGMRDCIRIGDRGAARTMGSNVYSGIPVQRRCSIPSSRGCHWRATAGMRVERYPVNRRLGRSHEPWIVGPSGVQRRNQARRIVCPSNRHRESPSGRKSMVNGGMDR